MEIVPEEKFIIIGDSPRKSGDGRPCWINAHRRFFENGAILISYDKRGGEKFSVAKPN